jgi:hypothetical protein
MLLEPEELALRATRPARIGEHLQHYIAMPLVADA